ncbi:fimbrial protein [Achromobacter marplatensis]|uniref:fimbrial protein n=1 Tax=Achromobacter marplatensis TaxID=470868 RepID=UPI000277EDEA|nr:fimbrial protein [Achromobacter marplatensis]EJO30312.1 fimbrial protein domain-containing protein [Achromobacter marplatensis]
MEETMNQTPSKRNAKSAILVALLLAANPIVGLTADKPDARGPHATFHVSGALLENACSLAMDSAYQEIWLGNTSTADLNRAGDQGAQVAIKLRLRGCVRTEGGRRDEHGGALAWSRAEPVIGVTFGASADMDNAELASVTGAAGFGLRLSDALRRPIDLNKPSRPWFVKPGDSVLTYYVTPERTSAPLRPGAFHAYINLYLTYD